MLLSKREFLMNVLEGAAGGGAGAGAASGANTNGASGNAGTANAGSAGGLDWGKIKESLPEDIRADSGLSTITSVEGLAKSYVSLQKGMGDKVRVPDKHATPEDWGNFFKKLGNPEKVDDYVVNVPKETVDDKFLGEIKTAAHAAGILPWQLEKVMGKYIEYAGGLVNQQKTEQDAMAAGDLEDIKKEWGEAFDTQKTKVNVALKELLPNDKDRERLIADGLGSHPSVVRILANAAKFFKEDTFIGHGEGKLGGVTPAEALEKANNIMGDMSHPYRNANHPNHKAAQKEVQALFDIAYPG